jgi:hypothetical protein
MGMMPNKSTSGGSMWTPQQKGDTSKMWKGGFGSGHTATKQGGFMNKNPGNSEQRNNKKSAGCAFCG